MDKKTLYLECYSGISGDMTVAALLDLGADQKVLLDGLDSLKVDGYRVVIGRRDKNSISACDFDVILEDDHAHAEPSRHHHEHSHEHRNLHDINAIIDQSGITARAKALAKKIFYIIAVAEAKAHAKPLDEVHFHEVGAIDSIVDIVAAAICFDNLNIQDVIVSELYEGTGQIKCQHGMLPIPVPAVINIAAEHSLPLHITDISGELVTPTGAAIVAAVKTSGTLPRDMKIQKLGLGAGKRNYPGAAGLLRAMLIEEAAPAASSSEDRIWVLEANLDDCPGEALALTMELLFEQGAKDVYYSPIYMKKNRPAYLLGVLCSREDIARLEGIIFTHTTTIGIRKHEAVRSVLPRVQSSVATPYGAAAVKVCTYQDKTFVYPEYDSLKSLCQKSGQDYMTLYHMVQSLYQAE